MAQSHTQSMTGYGEHRAKIGNHHWICRTKSLNHRFLDLKIRLPRNDWTELELSIRKFISEDFKRGSVEINLSLDDSKTTSENLIDFNLAQNYLKQSQELHKKLKLKSEPLSLESVLRLPGVIQLTNSSTSQVLEIDSGGFKKIFETVVKPALAALKQSRLKEGKALSSHLFEMLDSLLKHSSAIQKLETSEKEASIESMKNRIQETLKLFSSVSDQNKATFEQRLNEEASFWIEKRDFTEERVRLQTHIKHFKDELLTATEEGVGRKLEFLQQELLREVNTLGTKAQSPLITPHTIEMKSILEKMKEQLANVS